MNCKTLLANNVQVFSVNTLSHHHVSLHPKEKKRLQLTSSVNGCVCVCVCINFTFYLMMARQWYNCKLYKDLKAYLIIKI